ncbi:universal stress protein [Mycobacterium cookii]|uniref:Universal stress protein n=1 Tax=Mycobacterium cookii TaxID=1775 RepID=A0A7I7KUN1_9MYCO|nr:universal stress protein [Mycobacterium cookii]MCV7330921.1 universal stress protein [Mycobacterium cookii]BBX45052.1 universal stress protein [Mycobacterium cookii]
MSSQKTEYGVMVGVDGSPASDAAVWWGAREAMMRNIPLSLVHVANPGASTWAQAPLLDEFAKWQESEGRGMLANASKIAHDAATGAENPIAINTELLFSATVPTLVELSHKADLVVVGTDGRGALTRGLLGSVSSELLRQAHCPVAVVRDEEPRTQDRAQAPVLVGIDHSPSSELALKIGFDEASRRHVGLVALHAWSDRELVELPGIDWPAVKAEEERLLSEALAGWQERYPDVTVTKRLLCDRPAHALVDTSGAAQLVVVGSHGRNMVSRMMLGSVSHAVVQSVHRPVIVARP